MAYILKRDGKTPNTNYKHFNCDTPSDLSQIDLYLVPMGSTCRVISTGDNYILNSQKKWVKQPKGAISSDSETTPDDPTTPGDGNWNGGDLDDLS